MCVVVGYNLPGASETHYMATVKGAPETLKSMVSKIDVPFTIFISHIRD